MEMFDSSEYLEREDKMMYDLHKIRNDLADKKMNMIQINEEAEQILHSFGLSNLLIKNLESARMF